MTPNHTREHAPGDYTRSLLSFAALVQHANPELDDGRPHPVANGRAVKIGNWAIAVDEGGRLPRHFGKHANCSALARCVGCVPACSTETAAVDLSAQAEGCSALWTQVCGLNSERPQVTVRSYVPGRLDQSDLWVPALSPLSGRLQLFSLRGARMALITASGELAIETARLDPGHVSFAAMVFARLWKSRSAVPSQHSSAEAANSQALAAVVS